MYLPWLQYKKRGYDVHIFMIGKFQRTDTIDFKGCIIHLIPKPLFPRAMAKLSGKWIGSYIRLFSDNLCLYQSAVKVARQSPVKIVYSFMPWYAYAAWLLSKRYHCPCIKRIYGTFLYYRLFHGDGYLDRQSYAMEKTSWLWPADMTIITNDGTHGDKVAEFLGIKKDQYRFWLNGVDKNYNVTDLYAKTLRKETGLSDSDFVLLCLSRLSPWKRHDRAIQAMKLIIDELPNARLVFAGDGRSRAELTKLVADLGLTPFVKFLGMVPHDKVRKVMGLADVFLQTNDHSCLGNTLLEAMSCGRTIITWDVGGTGQVINDGDTGCLLPDPEPSTIAKAVISLAKNPEKAERLGNNARKFAEKNLQSWNERLDMEIDLVEKLCSQTDRETTFWPFLKYFGRGVLGRNNYRLQKQVKSTDLRK